MPSGTPVGDPHDTRTDPRQAARQPSRTETMDELRTMEVATLRERVVRSEYEVDARAVAGAILARLLAERPSAGEPRR